MAEIVDLRDKIKRYFTFTPLEIRSIIIAILIIVFVFSFKEWGYGDAFDVPLGLFNFFNAILIVALSFLVHISIQRIWSLGTGYRLEWKMWTVGLLFSLIMAFLTNGAVWLIIPGGFIVHHMAGHRLGWFRYDINYWALGLIAFAGPLANILLAIVFKSLSGFVSNALIQKVIIFNIMYAVFSMVPIPPLDGSKVYFGARMLYAFGASGIVAAAVLLYADIAVWVAVLASFIIAVILWLLYYIFFESGYWST